MNIQGLDVVEYLVQVAPVVVVMGVAIKALWKKNNELIEDIKQSDQDNLKTLEHLSSAITKLSEDGNRQFKDLKEHITERTSTISSQIHGRGKS